MDTRSQWHEIELPVPPVAIFNLLISLKPVRGRFGSVGAIATGLDGLWVVAWGSRENDPDYIAGARMKRFESPQRVLMAYEYVRGRSGVLPYGSGMTAEFTIQKSPSGSILRVTHAGFPKGPEGEPYFDSAGEGWRAVLQGIASILVPAPPQSARR